MAALPQKLVRIYLDVLSEKGPGANHSDELIDCMGTRSEYKT